ncbi:MAG: SIMPL domain-containing protein [Patescibacteria group bacterium]
MEQRIKTYLSVAVVLSILIIAGSAWSYVQTYSRSVEPSSFRSFSVSGEGKIVAVPDVAQFAFGVITEGGKDIAVLQRDNTAKVNKIIGFAKSKKIDAKDIKTQSYNLEPRYQYSNCSRENTICPPAEIVGYTITQSVSVKVRDFGVVGDILGGVVENGANNVSQLNFTVDDPTDLQNQARAEAIEKAKEKAKVLARAGGFGIGRLLSIDEGSNYYPPMPMYAGGAFEKSADEGAPVIEPGSQDIKINVTLRYEIR